MDAGALLNLTRELGGDAVDFLEGEYTVTLASYECGNAVWKECVLLDDPSLEGASEVLDFIESVLDRMEVLSLSDSGLGEEVLRKGARNDITYYDSAYLTAADEKDAVLVTDDEELGAAADKTGVETVSTSEISVP